jgi:glycosyltransferase involved in cell wall biosynthesis
MAAADSFKPVVVAPTFNNATTLPTVLAGINQTALPVIVVNDGSTDGSAAILQAWLENGPDRLVLTHQRNQGKAAALLAGFQHARQMGFTHAVTIDTDGQLNPAQIPELLRISRSRPTALVVGQRDPRANDCPIASRWGRRASNLLIRVESGACLSDSQCGFRIYPLEPIRLLPCRASRYAFESEILTRAAWAGIAIEQVNVDCTYDLADGRVSHFHIWRDSLASARMHLWLLLVSLLPRREPRLRSAPETGKIWLRLARWISPIRAWHDLRCDPEAHSRFATAIAVGVFIANLPLYGVQTLLSLYAAKRLRLNPVPVVIGSSISTPPLGPMLIAAAIALGHYCVHGRWAQLKSFDPRTVGYFALAKSVLLEWTIGGIICGIVLAVASYLVMRLALSWMPLHTPADSADGPNVPATGRDRVIPESMASER